MLYILSETNNKEVAEYIQPYCRDENLKVSFEALRCLLSSDDSYAIDTIKEYLRSDIRVRVEQAIALSGSFRIKEVVGDLIQMLKKTEMTGSDFYDKIPIVKALGDIGDPQAVDTLRRVLAKRSILFRGVSDRLKEEIYKTLNGYPYESVRDLVEAGLKSKNQYIRTESLRLSKANAQ
jgi:HEAT repeat protein